MSGLASIKKNLLRPGVLIVGGVIGLVILIRRTGSSGGDSTQSAAYLQAMTVSHANDNQRNVELAAIQAQTDQQRINADNTRFLVTSGFNADVTKTGIAAQTATVLATEQTKQLLGLASIQSDRDKSIAYQQAAIVQNTNERDKYIAYQNSANIHDSNEAAKYIAYQGNATTIQMGQLAVQNNAYETQKMAMGIDLAKYQTDSQERITAQQMRMENSWMAGSLAQQSQSNKSGGFSSVLNSIGGLAKSVTPLIGMFA